MTEVLDAGVEDAEENTKDRALSHCLAAFDSDMSVLSCVVRAIKALRKTSHQSVITSSPSSIQELDVTERADVPRLTERLLSSVFCRDENAADWTKLELVDGIDAITRLEQWRRKDLDAIAEKLGFCSQAQLNLARHHKDPSLELFDALTLQHREAQALFHTVFLGTRICVSLKTPTMKENN